MKNVTQEPKGFRDIYWCHILNEPMITHFDHAPDGTSRLFCTNCNWKEESQDPSSAFLSEHTFVCHILKPVSEADRSLNVEDPTPQGGSDGE